MRTPVALPPSSQGKERAMLTKRCHFKQTESLKERLASFAKEVRERASFMPPGRERDELLKKASQAETASHLNDWITLPGSQAPK
jgi:hypothetical protein